MKKLDPKAVWLFFINSVGTIIALSIVIGGILLWPLATYNVINNFASLWWVFAYVLISLVIISYIRAILFYRSFRYELTENGFTKESGVIYKRYVTIPYDRIQNIDINRGLIARMLGLSDIQVQTAGASGMVTAEGSLPGLSQKDAQNVRDELIQRAKHSKNQGL